MRADAPPLPPLSPCRWLSHTALARDLTRAGPSPHTSSEMMTTRTTCFPGEVSSLEHTRTWQAHSHVATALSLPP